MIVAVVCAAAELWGRRRSDGAAHGVRAAVATPQRRNSTNRPRHPLPSASLTGHRPRAASAARSTDSSRSYNNRVAITFDAKKRADTLKQRGLDFADAQQVFDGPNFEVEDIRRDYGEKRIILLRHASRSDRGCGLHPAWRGSSRLQDEESQ